MGAKRKIPWVWILVIVVLGFAVAKGVVDEVTKETPVRTATVMFEDGTTKVLEFGAERPEDDGRQAGTWMRVQGERAVWVVTDYTVTNIFKTVDDLRPE